jgi:hypothetical protein
MSSGGFRITMTTKLNSYPFDGWDFMEFADAWNVYVGDEFWLKGADGYHGLYTDADVISVYLEQVLKNYNGKPTRPMRKCAKDIRIFLKKLSKSEHHYDTPVWKGMSKIEDDFTLLSYAIKLMGNMWD